jgi:hypothetical protein
MRADVAMLGWHLAIQIINIASIFLFIFIGILLTYARK